MVFKKISILFVLVFILNGLDGFSQYAVSGTVFDQVSKPLEMVDIYDELSHNWVLTNNKGEFKLPVNSNYRISFYLLGKQKFYIQGNTNSDIENIQIFLKDKTLELDEVVVIGKSKKNKATSAVVLDKYAISQVQGFSLGDVLQQLPNSNISPVSLNAPKTIALRTAINTQNNRFGVSFILDGVQLSNDEGIDNYGSGELGRMPYSNVNDGFDLRQIPVSNIETVEVIGGVPDAKYTNGTTGFINVKRKAGVSKFNLRTQINGGTFGTSIDKGFKISDNLGNISLSLNYLKANQDPRNNLENFNRISASGIWSSSYKSKYKNTLSLTLQGNLDALNVDEEFDNGFQNAKYKKNKGITLSNRGALTLNSNVLDFFKYQVSLYKSKTDSYDQTFVNSGGKVVPTALGNELVSGQYTSVAYLSKRFIYSEPYTVNSNIDFGKNIKLENLHQSISLGTNLKYSANLGRGRVLDPASASTLCAIVGNGTSSSGVRPLDYGKYVVSQKLFGAYLQDNITYTFSNKRQLRLNLGLRYDNQNGYSSFAPRLNTFYELTEKIRLRAATGFLSKAPSLANLFPGDKYYDILIRDIRTRDYSYNLVQTFVKKIAINPLKPSKIWKYELGTDINAEILNFKLTGFYNNMYDGFDSDQIHEMYKLPEVKFDYPNGKDKKPTYKITGFKNIPITYKTTVNGSKSEDKGVELFASFKKIKSLNTTFSLVGSFTHSKVTSSSPYIIENQDPLETKFIYVYYHEKPKEREVLSNRLITTYHNPKLRLLCSVSSEFMMYSKNYATVKDIYPYAYKNGDLEYKTIQDKTNPEYEKLRLPPSTTKDVEMPFYSNFHLRITKEMLSGMSFSLYATNFLNYKPKIEVNGSKISPNADISFGGNIKYVF